MRKKLARADSMLVVIDVQEKLMPVIDDAAAVIANIERLVRGCKIFDVPALLTEQYVKGLGPTVPAVKRAFEETFGYEPIEKTCFSAAGDGEFLAALRMVKKKHVILAGVETHVCVYQTAIDLLEAGHEVHVAADAVSSRTASNRKIALQRMVSAGVKLTSTEMSLFELLGTSESEEFRKISRLVR